MSSHLKYRSCKTEWILWMTPGFSRRRINSQWTIIPRSQPTGNSLWDAEPRPKLAIWSVEYAGTSGNVFDSSSAPVSTPCTRMLYSWNSKATLGNPVQAGTVRPVARGEEQNRDTVPTPRFAKKTSTRDSLFPTEGPRPQNDTIDQQRLEISELHIDKFPTPSTFSCWKLRFETEVCSRSNFPRRQCYGSKRWRWSSGWTI